MFDYVILFGSAALTYEIVRKCCGKTGDCQVNIVIEYILYIMLDMVTTFLSLYPSGRVSLVYNLNGVYEMQYGTSAILFSIFISIVWGIIISYIKKYLKIDVFITKTKK